MMLPKFAEQSEIDPKNNLDVKAYPNPFNGEITFEYNLSQDDVQLAITDVVGKKVFAALLQERFGTISWKPVNIPPGIYFYSFVSNNQLEATGKIILVK